jgi:hypothetical protein
MKHLKTGMGSAMVAVALMLGSATQASALPIQGNCVDMDYSATGQITIDVRGPLAGGLAQGNVHDGRYVAGTTPWDPLTLTNGMGTVDGMAVYGSDTADASDDVVRFWITYAPLSSHRVWTMPTPQAAGPAEEEVAVDGPIATLASVPEPGSMFLLGSGLIGLAGAARRRLRPREDGGQ